MPVKANNHLATGLHYEQQALRFLTRSGLTLIDKNVRYAAGELDLIMRDGEQIVFVEVKFRTNNTFGGALASVTGRKQQRLKKAALLWLQKHNLLHSHSCRFDLVAINIQTKQLHYDWLKNIFQ
jgi:putative endonuclease